MTDKYAVIGNPISHSKSPLIHAAFAKQTQQDLTYEAIQVELTKLSEHLQQLIKLQFKGLNVTSPFKETMYKLVAHKTVRAQLAGAVNTVSIQSDGTLLGDNTDGIGLLKDLENNLNIPLKNKHILIFGAGGAARGVIGNLLAAQPATLTIANRNVQRAQLLVEQYKTEKNIHGCALETLPEKAFDIVINATSAALLEKYFSFPYVTLNKNASCYDLSYNVPSNPFLAWGHTQGATGLYDGLGMLVEQAAESFYVWRDIRPDTKHVLATLKQQ